MKFSLNVQALKPYLQTMWRRRRAAAIAGLVVLVLASILTTTIAHMGATPVSNGGKATATLLFGVRISGTASIEAAMKHGHLTRIYHVDYRTTRIFGICALQTVFVYGE